MLEVPLMLLLLMLGGTYYFGRCVLAPYRKRKQRSNTANRLVVTGYTTTLPIGYPSGFI